MYDEQHNPPVGETQTEVLHKLTELLLKLRLDIERALVYAYGSYSFDDVALGVINGRFKLYTVGSSFLICEYQKAPQYAIYHAFLAGGSLDELMTLHERCRADAKALGCKYATLNGRNGWVKPLKELGWEPRYTVMYCEV